MPRMEIHVNNLVDMALANNGRMTFQAKVGRHTQEMLESRMPEILRLEGRLTLKHDVGFRVTQRRFYGVIRDHAAHTVYTEGHALFLADLSEGTWKELHEVFAPHLLGTNYSVGFDFEPIDNPRNYGCSGLRGK